MTERDVTISPMLPNLLSVPIFAVVLAVCLVPYGLHWGWPALLDGALAALRPWVLIPVFLVGGCVHEGLHAVGLVLIARAPRSAVGFRFNWKALVPATHCSVPVSAGAYRISVLLPAIVLGAVPAIIGNAVGIGWLPVLGSLMLGMAAGDFMVWWVIRSVPAKVLVIDHPSRVGCRILDEDRLSE